MTCGGGATKKAKKEKASTSIAQGSQPKRYKRKATEATSTSKHQPKGKKTKKK